MVIIVNKDGIENIRTSVGMEARRLLEDVLTDTTMLLSFAETDSSEDIHKTIASNLSFTAQNYLATKRYQSARDMVFVLCEAQKLLWKMFEEEIEKEVYAE